MFSITIASITYSGSQDTALRCLAVLRLTEGCVVRQPLSLYVLASATSTSAGFFLVKFRLCVLGTALLTRYLWSFGAMAHTRAPPICAPAVVRPFYVLCRKTLPGFRTPFSFLLTGGGPGCATAIDGGRTAPAVFRHRRWDAGRLYTVDPTR